MSLRISSAKPIKTTSSFIATPPLKGKAGQQ